MVKARQRKRHFFGNVEKLGWVDEKPPKNQYSITMWLCGCMVASFTLCLSISLPMAMCIPIKVIRDKERKRVSIGWISRQMYHFGPKRKKLSGMVGLGSWNGSYVQLDRATNCTLVEKQTASLWRILDHVLMYGLAPFVVCMRVCLWWACVCVF